MVFDRLTEIVSHFIGIFSTTVEEVRMRSDYNEFKALKAQEAQYGDLLNIQVKVNSPYFLDKFSPGITSALYNNAPGSNPFLGDVALPQTQGPFPDWLTSTRLVQDGDEYFFYQNFPGNSVYTYTLEPASSVATITFQYNFLTDNDLYGPNAASMFADTQGAEAAVDTLLLAANALSGAAQLDLMRPDSFGGDVSVQSAAMTFYDSIQEVSAPALSGAEVTVLTGSDAAGRVENGVQTEELTTWADAKPAYFQSDDPEEGEVDPVTGEPVPVNPWNVDAGHAVVAGGNLLVNEAIVNSVWLDAPVISVMGDVIAVNAIAQVNVLMDYDTSPAYQQMGASQAFNAAAILYESSAAEGEDAAATGHSDGFSPPSNWVVTRIDGDVFQMNWVNQFNFATDNDRAEINFSGQDTYIGLGDNTMTNLASFFEVGFGYDLIIIGGSMITLNMVSQVNVLFDSDTLTYSGQGPDSVSMSDNFLLNSARISSVGIDSYESLSDSFAMAGTALEGGAETISATVAQDWAFDGIEVLRVLYISGDKITVNSVSQTNVLGDADQVYLALEEFVNESGADISVVTGSNALLNFAQLSDYGTDSTVMVGGEVYSDALIYQAELIDTTADPSGVNLTALASEAVAFLAEDMIEDAPVSDDLFINSTAADGTASPDVMQTMLA